MSVAYNNPDGRGMAAYPFLFSYAECARWLDHAKDPAKGRRVNPSGSYRLYKDEKGYVVKKYGDEVCRFDKRNVLTIYKWMYMYGASYYLPFQSTSNGRRVHRVNAKLHRRTTWANWQTWPLAFNGIKFDLNTGRCLNPKVEPSNEEPERNPVRYKKYLAAIKQLRTVVATQQRLGFFGVTPTYLPHVTLSEKVVAQELKSGVTPTLMAALHNRVWKYRHYDWQTKTYSLLDDAPSLAVKSVLDQVGRRVIKKHFGVYSQNKAR